MIQNIENFTFIELESVDSTHKYLQDYIKIHGYKKPISILTHNQTNGIGSRDNKWEGKKNNLFFSFAIDRSMLAQDLPIQSASIYFSFLLVKVLRKYNSKVWLKWPNDFYINFDKVGGTITNFKNNIFYCGIGLNLIETDQFKALDIIFCKETYLAEFFQLINSKILWKQIFSKYLIEFDKSRQFTTTVDNHKVSLENATLKDDGSIDIDNKKVFSLR